ncbi:MAG: nitroreductase family protein, partial [Acidimicrobiales bacterium]
MDDDPIGLLEGLRTTRAIRRYRPDPIPEADLATILWHASRAPTGSNRQPFRFV